MLRLGIVGCGNMAGGHAAACADLASRACVTAVVDVDEEHLKAAAAKFPEARAVADYRDIGSYPPTNIKQSEFRFSNWIHQRQKTGEAIHIQIINLAATHSKIDMTAHFLDTIDASRRAIVNQQLLA